MTTREENAKEMLRQIRELFEGEREYSHMTGDIELSGKTADDVIRQINEDKRNENGNR